MTPGNFNLQAGCKTTAMGIMPHTDIERALDLALGLDIPFWPQLPNLSFYEDMYAQASGNFPGVAVDLDSEKIIFDAARFEVELADYSRSMADPATYILSPTYSAVYYRFLSRDTRAYPAIRGQVIGPVSLGFRVADENSMPIIYNEGARALLFDFIQRKANTQYHQLKRKNRNAFVWLDEPGLGWVFSGLSGYSDVQAKQDYRSFLDGLDGPRALHLCANVNLPYLLNLGVEILSFDAYMMEPLLKGYVSAVADFVEGGGILCWGIVPTDSENLDRETPEKLAQSLSDYWEVVSSNTGLAAQRVAEQALICPARCCLKNLGRVGASDDVAASQAEGNPGLTLEEQLVERAFDYLKAVSEILRDRFGL